MFRVETITSSGQIGAIAAAWDALAAGSSRPMSTSDWYRCASRAVHDGERLEIITVWRGSALVGVAPLVLTSRAGTPRYEIIGTRTLYEPTEISVLPEAVSHLAQCILELKHPVVLTRLPRDAFTVAFAAAARRAGILLRPQASGSQYIELHGEWQRYYEARDGKLKNMLRRAGKQLAKSGALTFNFIRPDMEGVSGLLQEALEVEQRSWKGKAGSAVLQRPDLHAFFSQYALAAAQRGELLIASLRLDGKPLAMQIASVSGRTYWQLKIGYDERYARQLVGLQLQLETVRWSFEQGLERYEFLGTTEHWVEQWGPAVHRHCTLVFYPWSAGGLRSLLWDSAARVRARLARHRRPV